MKIKNIESNFKEIFIFGIGVTPQIVTEGIYSLYKAEQHIMFNEIFIITTKVGKDIISKKLIKESNFRDLCNDIGGKYAGSSLNEKNILVPLYENENRFLILKLPKITA